ncbi:MAG: hypothetical protein Q4E39_01920 [bacterium]|nr:hypothetical protein [bacterium]
MKHNLKNGIKLGVIIFAIMLIIPCNIKAQQKTTAKVSTATEACSNAIFSGKDMLTADIENSRIIIKANEGKWNIKYAVDDGASPDYSLVLGKNAKPTKFDYTAGNEKIINVSPGDAIFLVAEPQADKDGYIIGKNGKTLEVRYTKKNGTEAITTCKAGRVYINTSNKIVIENTAAYISEKFPINSNVNVNMDPTSSCKAMQEAKYDIKDNKPYLDTQEAIKGYNEKMKQSFPFCYDGYSSSFAVTKDTIDSVRKKSLEAYKQYLAFLSARNNNREYETSAAEIENPNQKYELLPYDEKTKKTKIPTLKCAKTQSSEETKKYYTRVAEVQNDLCKVTCQEQIQITYDPPVATKAGLCFQYKITVKSKVTCKTENTGNITWPTPPNICDYTPICSGNAQETQAGPNEDFDSCINQCDGGKYSQSCINKCYKKVYKKKQVKKTNNSNDNTTIKNTVNNKTSQKSSVTRISTDPYRNISGCTNNREIKNNSAHCAEEFYRLKQENPMGSYKAADTSIGWYTHTWVPVGVSPTTWSPANDDWIESIKRAAPYYFRSPEVALKTIQSFYGVNNGLNGFGEARTYIIDNGGIKRQRTEHYKCDEVCGFKSNSSGNCVSDDRALRDYYTDRYDYIITNLTSCTSKAVCKEGEASFNISTDNKSITEDERNNNASKWEASNYTNSNENTCTNPNGDVQMFIPLIGVDLEDNKQTYDGCNLNPNNGINGKCYGKDNVKYWQHYKTTITFPGTWIDLKTGRRYYHSELVRDTSIVREKPNYYCVGYNYAPVNEQWWNWKINQKGDPSKIGSVTEKTTYNIFGSFQDFGKYNWGFEKDKNAIQCFYAINNTVNTECKGAECNTTIDNVRLRPVDQANLFAGRSGDQVGFNWTSAAQDTVASKVKDNSKAKSYGIDPGKYAENLQKESKNNSEAAYSGDIEYSFHLTKENIKELRNYAKKNGYTSYNGTNKNEVKEIGLYYYESKILDNSDKYVSSLNRNTTLGCNGKECK